ncbi:MAG: GatB/YqeY domain-containing protein [bacterium]|nr:GatB/YqeY domain-containing protein [bacterium]
MILEKIQNDLKEAMKSGDRIKVSVLRFLLSAIKNKEISAFGAGSGNLSDEDVIGVIQKQAKERKESIEAFRSAGRDELALKEEGELVILNNYLPQQMTAEELEQIVTQVVQETGTASPSDFGKIMKAVMEKVKGKVDGSQVAELVKKSLGG